MGEITRSQLDEQTRAIGRVFWGLQAFIGGGIVVTGSWWLLIFDGVVCGVSAAHAIHQRQQFTEPEEYEPCSMDWGPKHDCVKDDGHNGKCICECQGSYDRHVLERDAKEFRFHAW